MTRAGKESSIPWPPGSRSRIGGGEGGRIGIEWKESGIIRVKISSREPLLGMPIPKLEAMELLALIGVTLSCKSPSMTIVPHYIDGKDMCIQRRLRRGRSQSLGASQKHVARSDLGGRERHH